jgi:hypothetical protein
MIDDEHISGMLFRVYNIIDGLDAGGKPLSYVANSKKQTLCLKCWLIVLEVYGSYNFDTYDDQTITYRANSLVKLKHAVEDLEALKQDSGFLTSPAVVQICGDISKVQHCLN